MKKTVMVIDGGGRGAVIVSKYLESKFVNKVLAVPGNDYMLEYSDKVKIYPKISTTDGNKILSICKKEKVDLIDVAQDNAIESGLTNILLENNFKVFGPSKEAGQIEWDKVWSKNFMVKFKIPCAKFKVFNSQKKAIDFINSQKVSKWFIKASGLAAGKGALLANNNIEAIEKIKLMKKFGKAGKYFLVEEFLEGEEFSSFAIVNGSKYKLLGHAQDHKTVYENNRGPNTGGMGCSSPPQAITKMVKKQIIEIYKKTATGLVKINRPYTGILYLGGLINKNGKVFVIEFNARWGDPEAQVIIPSLKNDLFNLATGTLKGKLPQIRTDNLYRVVITGAAEGYPDDYSNVIGKKIFNIEKTSTKKKIFGAGIKKTKNGFIVNGGRIFYVLGSGKNVDEAKKDAYSEIQKIYVKGNNLHYRKDIGFRDMDRLYK